MTGMAWMNCFWGTCVHSQEMSKPFYNSTQIKQNLVTSTSHDSQNLIWHKSMSNKLPCLSFSFQRFVINWSDQMTPLQWLFHLEMMMRRFFAHFYPRNSCTCPLIFLLKQARKLQATLEDCNPKLWLAHSLTGVKCRATSVAKKYNVLAR